MEEQKFILEKDVTNSAKMYMKYILHILKIERNLIRK